MKKIILSAAALLATVAVSSAQNSDGIKKTNRVRNNWSKSDSAQRKTPEQAAQLQTERLKTKLNLDEKQSKEVYQLALERAKIRQAEVEKRRADFKEKSAAQREQMTAMREQMKAKREADMKAYDGKLQQILNKEQFDKYNQMKSDQMNQMKNRMKNRGGGQNATTPTNPS